jgi:hypothetical protein
MLTYDGNLDVRYSGSTLALLAAPPLKKKVHGVGVFP